VIYEKLDRKLRLSKMIPTYLNTGCEHTCFGT